MGMLQPVANRQGYLKAGFFGFTGTGKTHTATGLACAVHKQFGYKTPIAFFDTENGSVFMADRVLEATGLPLVGVPKRSFADLMEVTKEVDKEGIKVLLVDSITHVWNELCTSHLENINAKKRAKGWRESDKLEFQHWAQVKQLWADWTNWYLNSECHVIFCGRAGFTYDMEKNEETKKRELVKTGTKVKVESEFGFEPSLLVEMVLVDSPDDEGQINRAIIRKDRYNLINGMSFDMPRAAAFKPHTEKLVPASHVLVDTTRKTETAKDEDGSTDYSNHKREVKVVLEKIEAELLKAHPSSGASDKRARLVLMEKHFHTTSETELEGQRLEALRAGLATLCAELNPDAPPLNDVDNRVPITHETPAEPTPPADDLPMDFPEELTPADGAGIVDTTAEDNARADDLKALADEMAGFIPLSTPAYFVALWSGKKSIKSSEDFFKARDNPERHAKGMELLKATVEQARAAVTAERAARAAETSNPTQETEQ